MILLALLCALGCGFLLGGWTAYLASEKRREELRLALVGVLADWAKSEARHRQFLLSHEWTPKPSQGRARA